MGCECAAAPPRFDTPSVSHRYPSNGIMRRDGRRPSHVAHLQPHGATDPVLGVPPEAGARLLAGGAPLGHHAERGLSSRVDYYSDALAPS